MKMKVYGCIWALTFCFFAFEYYVLNFSPQLSVFLFLQHQGFIRESLKISAEPGRPLSLWLGYLGFGFMIIMNLYSVRKRIKAFQNLGKISSWLNFHVFCGLIGPTFILFHCNFKVRGIVGISFWSMVVSFSSGIIGRYFYVQMLKAKVEFENEADKILGRLKTNLEKRNIQFDEPMLESSVSSALRFVGVPQEIETLNPVMAFAYSTIGDIRRAFAEPDVPKHWPSYTKMALIEIAVQKRRALFLESFQRLMGYWHTFHFPFAVFMYIAAVIHVIAYVVLGI